MLKFQFKLLLSRKEFSISFFAILLYSIVAFALNCFSFYGQETSELLPANQLMLIFNNTSHTTVFTMLLPLIVTIPFADTFFTEYQNRTLPVIMTRANNREKYYFSKLFVVFLSATFIVLIPLLINFALSLIAFPTETIGNFDGWSTSAGFVFEKGMEKYILFYNLFYKHPLLYNFLFCFLISIFSGLGAVLAYNISFFIKKTRILVFTVFFIIMEVIMLISAVVSDFFEIDLYYYNYFTAFSQIIGKNIYLSFIVLMTIFIVVLVVLIHMNLKKIRDIL